MESCYLSLSALRIIVILASFQQMEAEMMLDGFFFVAHRTKRRKTGLEQEWSRFRP